MEIKIMKIQDYSKVYTLWINTPGMGLNDIDDSKAGIKKYLKRNPKTCFIAKEGNKIVGAILSGHDGRRGYIYHIVVDLKYRNNGLGKKLVNYAVEGLKKEGINKVAFVVFKKNEIGNDFWEKLGFNYREDLIYRNKLINENIKRIDT